MVSALFLTWGLVPLLMGIGFIFTPRLMARLERAYDRRARRFQKRLFKARRTTGLSLVLVGMILLFSFMDPGWFYRLCYMAGFMAGTLFPGLFISTPPPPAVPTFWI